MLLVIHWLMTPFMMTLGTESPTVCCDLFAEQELQHSKWGDVSFSRFARNMEHWHLDIIHLLEIILFTVWIWGDSAKFWAPLPLSQRKHFNDP